MEVFGSAQGPERRELPSYDGTGSIGFGGMPTLTKWDLGTKQ